jgi:CheY-like chemotaxis protein
MEQSEPFSLVLIDSQMPEMDGFALAERIQQIPQRAGAIIMMHASGAFPRLSERCRELGIVAHLLKPIIESELLRAILTATGYHKDQVPTQESTLGEEVERPGQTCRSLRILVAEDNPFNQTVAMRLLENRGHTVEVVETGKNAIAALQTQPFDLILMDVQMPEMDGLAATAEIRKNEMQTGGHMPIIAMTAHAMTGDRERCLQAGMDAYVSKPIDADKLLATIEALVDPGVDQDVPSQPLESDAVFEHDSALLKIEGNTELLRELAMLFLEECPQRLSQIKAAVQNRDAKTLERAAHTLKGSVGFFFARATSNTAGWLEAMARENDLANVDEAYAALEREIERLRIALTDLVSGKQPLENG